MVKTLWPAVLVAVAGCGYSASFDGDCAISCSSGVCPSGFVCGPDLFCRSPGQECGATGDAGGADAMTGDGDAGTACPGDIDCDGVPDGFDNCKTVKNPDQHDEDQDGLGDVCDPCPPFQDNTDTDLDGVGDLCDPNPGRTGDQLWLFEGFQHGIPSGWTASPLAAWVPTNGEDVAATTVSMGGDASLAFDGAADPHWTVSTAFTVTSLTEGLAGETTFAGVAAGSMQCGTYDDFCSGCGGERDLTLINSGSLKSPTPYQLVQGVEYVVKVDQLAGPMFDCSAVRPDTNVSATTDSVSGPANSSSQASVVVSTHMVGATAQFHWVMIVTSP